jgi:hypothetical protein
MTGVIKKGILHYNHDLKWSYSSQKLRMSQRNSSWQAQNGILHDGIILS